MPPPRSPTAATPTSSAATSARSEELEPLLQELTQNITKVREHEQRASGIINGMLRHARNNRGE